MFLRAEVSLEEVLLVLCVIIWCRIWSESLTFVTYWDFKPLKQVIYLGILKRILLAIFCYFIIAVFNLQHCIMWIYICYFLGARLWFQFQIYKFCISDFCRSPDALSTKTLWNDRRIVTQITEQMVLLMDGKLKH